MVRQRRISQSGGATLVQAILLVCASLLGGAAWGAVQFTKQFPLERRGKSRSPQCRGAVGGAASARCHAS